MSADLPMTVLVCGASGFLGRAICARLRVAGHTVLRGQRHAAAADEVAIDYRVDTSEAAWLARLRGVDAVVNAVGIITESAAASFDALHERAPCALFAACASAGVRRVVQISALGAADGSSAYHRSKRAADRSLEGLALDWLVLRPSLVYGRDGVSSAMFRAMASLPVVPLPALGAATFQPVHVDDVADAVLRALAPDAPRARCIDLVGSTRLSFAEMLALYRRAMGLGRLRAVTLPAPLMTVAAHLARYLPGSPLTPDNWRMLRAGSAADATACSALLGRLPRAADTFISADDAELLRLRALATWRGALLRYVLALVWLVTAWVSLFAYPVSGSLALLAEVGLHGAPAHAALYGASALDLCLGLASLLRPCRALWLAQGALVVGYTAIITLALPALWAHPFGPVLKNLPILAILFILWSEEAS
jgi:uncharacterized protein YbjT (DUF2867 family)